MKTIVLLLVLFLCACDTRERDFRPPVRVAKSRHAIPPPPPPPPRDAEGDGPALVPEAIASFFATAKDGDVVLYRFDEKERRESFHGHPVAASFTLPRDLAAKTIAVMTSPGSYTDNHPLCTDEGIGMRVSRGGASIDLYIGLICRHVHDGESGEEIGVLSTSGQEFFVQLARGLH